MDSIDLFTTAALHEADRLNSEMADLLIEKLRKQYPLTWTDFFPANIAPTPDLDLALDCGIETLRDVARAAEAVMIASAAKEEIEARRYPN